MVGACSQVTPSILTRKNIFVVCDRSGRHHHTLRSSLQNGQALSGIATVTTKYVIDAAQCITESLPSYWLDATYFV